MKVIELMNLKPALDGLVSQPLAVAESLSLARLVKSINTELQTIDKERIKICEQYGTKSEDGQQYVINNHADFDKEINELMTADIDLEIKPISIKSDIKITVNDIIALDGIVIFKTDGKQGGM